MSMNDRTYIVTEVCPHCENEIEMRWDTDTRGYKAICPVCGETLMLCDECQHSGPDGGPIGPCDYDGDTGTCRFNLPAKKVRRKLVPGSVITSLDELLEQKLIWWMGRAYHNGWFGSWQLRWAATRLREGQIRRVEYKEEAK